MSKSKMVEGESIISVRFVEWKVSGVSGAEVGVGGGIYLLLINNPERKKHNCEC